MSFTESNTVEQMILDAGNSLGSGAVQPLAALFQIRKPLRQANPILATPARVSPSSGWIKTLCFQALNFLDASIAAGYRGSGFQAAPILR